MGEAQSRHAQRVRRRLYTTDSERSKVANLRKKLSHCSNSVRSAHDHSGEMLSQATVSRFNLETAGGTSQINLEMEEVQQLTDNGLTEEKPAAKGRVEARIRATKEN